MKKLLFILMSALVAANTFAGDLGSSPSSSLPPANAHSIPTQVPTPAPTSEDVVTNWYSAPVEKITSGTMSVVSKINNNKVIAAGLIAAVVASLVAYKYRKAIAKRLKKAKTYLVG